MEAAQRKPAGQTAVDTVIIPRTRDLGDGFHVRRALPSVHRRMVGPFVFFDQMGPILLRDGQGLDVRPHPHIGLATVTYLFDGEILHRDSLGTVQPIRPGEVNWMVAGRGIAHSERTPADRRRQGEPLFGIQCWLALPRVAEETAPTFVHHAEAELPVMEDDGARLRLIAGTLFGAQAPVRGFSDLFYADVVLQAGGRLPYPAVHEERAFSVADGEVRVGDETFQAGELAIMRPGTEGVLSARTPARLMLLGGEPMDGPRHLWWNFVSSSQERIQQGREDWRAGRFAPVPDQTEFIPLPAEPPPPVAYP